MTEKDDKIFTPILVAVLGFFGAAIAPSVQFVNGFWNYQLKQQEIAHKIVLDLAQLAIQEGVSQEYQRDTLNVIASISGNPLETWAEAKLKKHQDTEEKLRYIVSKRFTVQKYESLEECQTHLKEQKELYNLITEDMLDSQTQLTDTIRTATTFKDDYILQVDQDCQSIKNSSVNVSLTNITLCRSPQELNQNILKEIFPHASAKGIIFLFFEKECKGKILIAVREWPCF